MSEIDSSLIQRAKENGIVVPEILVPPSEKKKWDGGYFPASRYTEGSIRHKQETVRVAQMKVRMLALYKEDHTYPEIANQINQEFGTSIGHHNVIYHIKNMLEYWKTQSADTFEHKQALVLAGIAQIEEMATEAYFRSMQGKETKVYEKQISRMRSHEYRKIIKQTFDEEVKKAQLEGRDPQFPEDKLPDLLKDQQEKIKKYRRIDGLGAGNDKFLRIMLDCVEKRAKIWNLYKDQQALNPEQEAASLTDEERKSRLANVINMAMARKLENQGRLSPGGPLGEVHESEIKPSQKVKKTLDSLFGSSDEDF